jgi:hypothetical protein
MDKLEDKYSRIRAKHPRVDLKLIEKVKVSADKVKRRRRLSGRKEVVKKADIMTDTKLLEGQVTNALNYLVESKYLDVKVKGGKFFGFSTEKKDGSYGETLRDKESISSTVKNAFKKAVTFFKRNMTLLDSVQSKQDLEVIITMGDKDKPPIGVYNRLVQVCCWDKGRDDLEKLSFRSTANRYA